LRAEELLTETSRRDKPVSNRDQIDKYVIFVSDGIPTADEIGVGNNDRNKERALDQAQKVKDIPNTTVYAIGFDINNGNGKDFMEQVASDPSKAYNSPDKAKLLEALIDIYQKLIQGDPCCLGNQCIGASYKSHQENGKIVIDEITCAGL